jgi:hypothetical protein
MRAEVLCSLAALLVVALPGLQAPAGAQPTSATSPVGASDKLPYTECSSTDPSDACSELFDPDSEVGDLEGAVLGDRSAVTVAIGEDKETASIRFVKPWLRHKLSATVSAPVDEDSGQAEFVGVAGLNGAASLKLEYNYIDWPEYPGYALYKDDDPGSYPGGQQLQREEAVEALRCLTAAERLSEARAEVQMGSRWTPALEDLYSKLIKMDLPTRAEIVDFQAAFPEGGEPQPRTEQEDKADVKVRKLLEAGTEESHEVCAPLRQYLGNAEKLHATGLASRREVVGRRSVLLWGFNGTVGQKKFTFLDRGPLEADGTIEKIADRELPWSLGARAGWIFLSKSPESQGEESLIFSVNFDRGYKASDAVDVCKPVEGLESVPEIASCEELALGGPRPLDSVRYVAEYRFLAKHLGAAIRAFYEGSDDESDDWGLETPFYFVTNADGDFQGGVIVGWREEDDDVSIAVFVGRKFELF